MALFLITFFCFLGTAASYDFVFFVTIWGPSFCTDSYIQGKCKMPVTTDMFTIQGIWPQDANGVMHINCGKEVFDEQKVESIKKELDIYWPSFSKSFSNLQFWRLEWERHGTCTGWTIQHYFQTGLKPAWENNVLSTLRINGIHPGPGAMYHFSAIEAAFGGKAVAVCGKRYSKHGIEQLERLFFCLDDNQNTRPCSAEERKLGNCKGQIAFPDATILM